MARALGAWRFAERRDWRQPLAVTIRYVHGNDPHVEVKARGHVGRFPWDMAILDVLATINSRSENRHC